MIEKIKVRKRLASYENQIKEEMKSIENKLKNMKDACKTAEMQDIFYQSKQYAVLLERYGTLRRVCSEVLDIRCETMFDDTYDADDTEDVEE